MIPLFDILQECVTFYQDELHQIACVNSPRIPREKLRVCCRSYTIQSTETEVSVHEPLLLIMAKGGPFNVVTYETLNPFFQKKDILTWFKNLSKRFASSFQKDFVLKPLISIASATLTFVKGHFLRIDFDIESDYIDDSACFQCETKHQGEPNEHEKDLQHVEQESDDESQESLGKEEDVTTTHENTLHEPEKRGHILLRLRNAFPEYEIHGCNMMMGANPDSDQPLMIHVQLEKKQRQPEHLTRMKFDIVIWHRFLYNPCMHDAVTLLNQCRSYVATLKKNWKMEGGLLKAECFMKWVKRVYDEEWKMGTPYELRYPFNKAIRGLENEIKFRRQEATTFVLDKCGTKP